VRSERTLPATPHNGSKNWVHENLNKNDLWWNNNNFAIMLFYHFFSRPEHIWNFFDTQLEKSLECHKLNLKPPHEKVKLSTRKNWHHTRKKCTEHRLRNTGQEETIKITGRYHFENSSKYIFFANCERKGHSNNTWQFVFILDPLPAPYVFLHTPPLCL